jgi:hypothetical protein
MLRDPGSHPLIRRRLPHRFSAVLFSCAVFALGGCASRKTPAFSWHTASIVRPRIPLKPNVPPAEEPAPDLRPLIPPPSFRLVTARSAPPRPRSTAGAESDSDSTAAVQAPSIAPQLTPDESAAAQQQTSQRLSIAERNLGRASGRTLTTMQADLVEKIRGFIGQAREAARGGDWVRARNLAEKAQLLSQELVRTP